MPRGVSAAFLSVISGNEMSSANLLELYLDGGQILRLTDVTVQVPYNGNTYEPFPFEYTPPKQSNEVPQITVRTSSMVTVDDGGTPVTLTQWILSHGLEGKQVIIRNTEELVPNEAAVMFVGAVSHVTGDAGKRSLSVVLRGRLDFVGETYPTCYSGKNCNLNFGGPKCGYSGPDTTCGHTLADCIDKLNQANFRGDE